MIMSARRAAGVAMEYHHAMQQRTHNFETAARIALLAAEYVALVTQMRSGAYDDEAEWRALSSQRSLVHDELIVLTGVTDRAAMYAHCRAIVAADRE